QMHCWLAAMCWFPKPYNLLAMQDERHLRCKANTSPPDGPITAFLLSHRDCPADSGHCGQWIICPTFSADADNMLQLRRDHAEAPSSDLRMFARKEQKMIAEAHRLDHSLIAHRQPRLRLAVRDLSVNG